VEKNLEGSSYLDVLSKKENPKMEGGDMTQEQLLKYLHHCKWRWNGWGEDVFQEACLIALQRYKTLDNVNQFLFKLLCKEAARKLLKHQKHEIAFSQLQNFEETLNTLADPCSTDTLLTDTNDFDFDEALDNDFVSFSDKKQLFQLPLFFTTFVTPKLAIQKT
jgi:DNA-directed RNA polymerase specialized sigma24 family protein